MTFYFLIPLDDFLWIYVRLSSPLETRRMSRRLKRVPSLSNVTEDQCTEIARARIWRFLPPGRALLHLGELVLISVAAILVSQPFPWVVQVSSAIFIGVVLLAIITEYGGYLIDVQTPVQRVLTCIANLEKHPKKWQQPNYQSLLCVNLESLAKAIDTYPKLFSLGGDPVLMTDLSRVAQRKATGVRELKRWVLAPNPFTFTDLSLRLRQILDALVARRIDDLADPVLTAPERPQNSIAKKAIAAAALLVIVAGLSAAVLIGKLSAQSAGVIAGLAAAVSLPIARRLGVDADAASRDLKSGREVLPPQKN